MLLQIILDQPNNAMYYWSTGWRGFDEHVRDLKEEEGVL